MLRERRGTCSPKHLFLAEALSQRFPQTRPQIMHRVEIKRQRIVIDATFPGPPWDENTSLPLACGPGEDFPAGCDPDADKRRLEAEHCDPVVREPFIEALAQTANADR
jgi:hypothetical protein